MSNNAVVPGQPNPQAQNSYRAQLGRPLIVTLYLLLMLALFAGLAVAAWLDIFGAQVPRLKDGMFKLYLYVACAGGLGALVSCMRGVYWHVAQKDYDTNFVYWYFFRPWVGLILGLVSYFLIAGGLLAFDAATPGDSFRAKALFVAVAFLAGFCANDFMTKISAVAQVIFQASGTPFAHPASAT